MTVRPSFSAPESPDFPWYLKTQLVLFNVSTIAAIVITVLYYALLTPDQYHMYIITMWTKEKEIFINIFFLWVICFSEFL